MLKFSNTSMILQGKKKKKTNYHNFIISISLVSPFLYNINEDIQTKQNKNRHNKQCQKTPINL